MWTCRTLLGHGALWLLFACLAWSQQSVSVLTWHNDIARTGANLAETVLTPQNVNSSSFGKIAALPVDGDVYAQPLVLPGVAIPGQGVHTVVYVATEHDSVYAFDASGTSQTPLWRDSFGEGQSGVRPVAAVADVQCGDLVPQVGITGTPVIDAATGTLYVVTATWENGVIVDRLHALDVTTGAEKFGGPVRMQASVPGTGVNSVGGVVSFDASHAQQRPGLLLLNGAVYVAFASYCDLGNYHGWILGYNASTLTLQSAFTPTPNTAAGGIWQGGVGLGSDGSSIYAAIGNGGFDANTGGSDYGESLLRLSPQLQVEDWFTPYDVQNLNQQDLDLASAGPIVLPDQAGTTPHLLIASGKEGTVYVLNRDGLGGFNASGDTQTVQTLTGMFRSVFGGFAWWNQTLYGAGVYRWGATDVPKALALNQDQLSLASEATTPFGYPGATPSISANGNSNGILWAVQTDAYQGIQASGGPAVLHAYDATNLGHELYNSSQAGSRDQMGQAIKFAVPTIANGHVYVGTRDEVDVFGLLSGFTASLSPVTSTVPAQTGASLTLATAAINGDTRPLSLSCIAPASGCQVSPGLLAPGQSATVTISAAAMRTGPNVITIQASNGGVTHLASATVLAQDAASTLQPPLVLNVTSAGFTLDWNTSQALNSQVWYGASQPAAEQADWELTTQHSITLSGLQPNTTYQVKIESSYFANPDLISPVFTVTTGGGTAPPDFTMGLSPASSSVSAGSGASLNLSTTAVNGDAGPLTLTCTAPATGCSVTPGSITPGQSAAVSVAASGLQSGANTVTVSASDGTNTHTASASVTVAAAAPPDFTLGLSPASSSVSAGSGASLNLSTTAVNGDAGPLTLTCVAPATGCSVSPGSITPGQSAAVSVAASGLQSGANTITVSASDGTNTHTASASVTVAAAAGLPVPTITGITSTSFTVSWQTAQALNTQVWYGTSTPATLVSNWNLVTQHSATVTGLQPGATYQVKTESSYFSNPDLLSPVFTVTTTAVTAPPDFTVALSPPSGPVGPGAGVQLSLATTTVNGDTKPLALNCSTPASGCQVSPASIAPGQTATVTVTATALQPGLNTITVGATDGSLSHSASATVTVTSTTAPDFTAALSPPSSPVATGTPVNLTLLTTALGGDASPLTLNCTQPSSGCSVSPPSIAPGQSAVVSIPAAALSIGLNPVAVTATDGANTHTANGTVTVSTSAGGMTAPVVSQVTSTSFTLSWQTTQPLNTQVWYGTAQPDTESANWLLMTQHSLTVTGLQPGTSYQVMAESSNYSNPDLYSVVFTVTTAP